MGYAAYVRNPYQTLNTSLWMNLSTDCYAVGLSQKDLHEAYVQPSEPCSQKHEGECSWL